MRRAIGHADRPHEAQPPAYLLRRVVGHRVTSDGGAGSAVGVEARLCPTRSGRRLEEVPVQTVRTFLTQGFLAPARWRAGATDPTGELRGEHIARRQTVADHCESGRARGSP